MTENTMYSIRCCHAEPQMQPVQRAPLAPASCALSALHLPCPHSQTDSPVYIIRLCSTSGDMLAAFDEGDCLRSADGPDALAGGSCDSMDASSSFDGFDTGHRGRNSKGRP